ncbi:MAG TPA: hypothetical protein VGI10_19135 [Polyangiaceae bacterium]
MADLDGARKTLDVLILDLVAATDLARQGFEIPAHALLKTLWGAQEVKLLLDGDSADG